MRILLLFACLYWGYVLAESDDVLDLSSNTKDSFKSQVGLHDVILVEFFAPWCGHCKRLAPEYAKASTVLKSNDPPVPLAKVDCTSDNGKDICSEYGVSGYPTLKIFRGGEFSQEYDGPRDADGIVKYMRSQVGPASKLYSSFKDLASKLKDIKDVAVVGLFNSDSDELHKKFIKAADKMRESVFFAHILADSSSDKVASLKAFDLEKANLPSVYLVRPSIYHNKFEAKHLSFDESDELDKWINNNYHGLVGVRTQSNMGEFKNPLVIAYFEVDYVKNPKGTNYWRNRILKVATNYKDQVNFAVANSASFAGEMEEYGLESSKSGRDTPPVVTARDKDGKKFVMKDKFSVETFEKFVKDFLDGKLEAFLKSEEIPEDNDKNDVKVAVGKNFDELVTRSQKDILIEFYAPWCGHCKKLAPTWEELGKAMKDESGVEIVKMDATANDIPSTFTVHGFPTIFFYPADTKVPKKYEGGRELNDFIKYLAKHSSKLQGYNKDGQKKDEL